MAYKVIRSTGDYRLYLTLSKGTPNIAGNYTPVTVKLYLKKNTGTNMQGLYTSSSSTWNWSGSGITSRSGSYTLDFRSPKDNYGEILLKNETFNVSHNSDGSRGNLTVNATVNFAHTYFPSRVSISESTSFTTIPRASTISLSGGTTTNSTVNVNISRASDSFTHKVWYRIGSEAWILITSSAKTSASFTIQPSQAGMINKTSASVEVSVQTLSGTTNIGSEVRSTRTISVPSSSVSLSGGTETGTAQTASVSNSGGSGLTHSYSWTLGSSTNGNSSSWTPPHSALPTSTSGELKVTVVTKNGTATVSTVSTTKRLTVPSSIIPTVGSISSSELDTITKGLGLPGGSYVQSMSRLRLSADTVAAGSGSSITEYRWTIAGVGDRSTTTSSVDVSKPLPNAGEVSVSVQVVDARGRVSAVRGSSVTVLEYNPPRISGTSVYRSDSSGLQPDPFSTFVVAQFRTSVSSLGGKNTATYRLRSKPIGGSYTTLIPTTSVGINQVITTSPPLTGFLITIEYQFEVVITDKYLSTTIESDQLFVPTAGVNLAIGHGGTASSSGKLPTHGSTYAFEFGSKGVRSDGPIIGKEGREISYDSLFIPDTRDDNQPPSWYYGNYLRRRVTEFKNPTAIGLGNATGTYVALETIVPWTDASGGEVKQLAYGNNNEVFLRTSSSNSAWRGWVNVGDADILNKVYPVGAIYISVVNTNPGTLFGGTWAVFASGRTLVGVDTGQTEFNTVQKTGGHKSLQAHTHTVSGSTNKTGSHTHQNRGYFSTTGGHATQFTIAAKSVSSDPVQNNALLSAGNHSHTVTGTAASTGGGDSQNLQPYITVYMWRRTA